MWLLGSGQALYGLLQVPALESEQTQGAGPGKGTAWGELKGG